MRPRMRDSSTENTKGIRDRSGGNCHQRVLIHRHPAVFSNTLKMDNFEVWWQAGLRACKIWFIAFPSMTTQWPVDKPTLAYRCGGSTGIVNRMERLTHLFPSFTQNVEKQFGHLTTMMNCT